MTDPLDLPEVPSNRLQFRWPDLPDAFVTDEAAAALVDTWTTFTVGGITVPAKIIAAERYGTPLAGGLLITVESPEPAP
jgi:hypothetical protein